MIVKEDEEKDSTLTISSEKGEKETEYVEGAKRRKCLYIINSNNSV